MSSQHFSKTKMVFTETFCHLFAHVSWAIDDNVCVYVYVYHFIGWIVSVGVMICMLHDTYETQTNHTNIDLVAIRAKWMSNENFVRWCHRHNLYFPKDAYHFLENGFLPIISYNVNLHFRIGFVDDINRSPVRVCWIYSESKCQWWRWVWARVICILTDWFEFWSKFRGKYW